MSPVSSSTVQDFTSALLGTVPPHYPGSLPSGIPPPGETCLFHSCSSGAEYKLGNRYVGGVLRHSGNLDTGLETDKQCSAATNVLCPPPLGQDTDTLPKCQGTCISPRVTVQWSPRRHATSRQDVEQAQREPTRTKNPSFRGRSVLMGIRRARIHVCPTRSLVGIMLPAHKSSD